MTNEKTEIKLKYSHKPDGTPKTCPVCGKSVVAIHDGGDGSLVVIRDDGCRPPRDGNDLVHVGCMKNEPDNFYHPCWP